MGLARILNSLFGKWFHKGSDMPWASKWKPIVGLTPKFGGQGKVTFVEHADKHVRGALKTLRDSSPNSRLRKERRARMRREVVALETLKGTRGITRVLDHNTDRFDDLSIELYVVQELIEGRTLAQHADPPVGITEATRITVELCELVKECHGAGVLHREIKPDNIIIDSLGAIWLVDFGLTYVEESDSLKTDTNEEIGNRFLRVPEYSSGRGAKYAPQSDLTLICGVLFKLITGHKPSNLQDDRALPPHLSRHSPVEEEIKSDPRWPRIKSIFDIGFAVDINLRFSTADELLRQNPSHCLPDVLSLITP
jgi:serine/threonine protein kinase